MNWARAYSDRGIILNSVNEKYSDLVIGSVPLTFIPEIQRLYCIPLVEGNFCEAEIAYLFREGEKYYLQKNDTDSLGDPLDEVTFRSREYFLSLKSEKCVIKDLKMVPVFSWINVEKEAHGLAVNLHNKVSDCKETPQLLTNAIESLGLLAEQLYLAYCKYHGQPLLRKFLGLHTADDLKKDIEGLYNQYLEFSPRKVMPLLSSINLNIINEDIQHYTRLLFPELPGFVSEALKFLPNVGLGREILVEDFLKIANPFSDGIPHSNGDEQTLNKIASPQWLKWIQDHFWIGRRLHKNDSLTCIRYFPDGDVSDTRGMSKNSYPVFMESGRYF